MTARKIISAILIGLFVYVASPLLLPLAMGAVFAVLFFPWLKALEKRKVPVPLASAILTIGVSLGLLLPVAILAFMAAKTGLQQLRMWKEAPHATEATLFHQLVEMPWAKKIIDYVTSWFPIGVEELATATQDLASSIGLKIADLLAALFTQLPSMAMGLAITVLSIFFFLADGKRLLSFIRENSVLSKRHTDKLFAAFAGMCRSVVLATVVSGFIQAIIYSLAVFFVGAKNAPLIGFLVFLASFIPLIGSFPLTIGVAVQQFFIGNRTAGTVLLIMAIITSLSDNVVRPLVLKGGAQLHPLLAFVAAFGGLQVLGFSGVFLGPIIAGLFVVTIKNLIHGDVD
ncbi:MAG: hypothetical protein A3K03_01470 [Bdellovibrionales bacterium RIFOXYD1_FULL_44_7]|nr:MAG: hypothetical protein A3K03_01470 [Bdellovibrionales bacterium RIFOXYD1_FULL_44_7]